MNILHITASYKPAYVYGGPVVSVSALCEQLQSRGVQITVFSTTANGNAELDVPTNSPVPVDGISVYYFKRISGDPTHLSPGFLRKLWVSCRQFDVIHVHTWWNTFSVLGALIGVIRGVPVVLSPRGTLSTYSFRGKNRSLKALIHFFFGRWLLPKFWFHVTSYHEEKDIYRFGSTRKIVTIPNMVRFPATVPAPNVAGEVFRLVFFSRIDEKKGLDLLIRALATVDIPYTLHVGGMGDAGYIDSLKVLAAALGVSVGWKGQINGDSKYDFLAGYDMSVLPSLNENFGNVVIESLSVGTPVLVSNEVGLCEYIEASGFGWVCDPAADAIREAIRSAYHDKQKRDHIRETAPKTILSDFDSNQFADQYIGFYRTIVHE